MSKKCNTVTGVLQRKGTDQLLRNKYELDPASVELMDFDLEDWMKFAYNFAEHVNYFSEENSKISNGDWRSFFKDSDEIKTLLEELDETNSVTPHLTLFICFLKLLDFSKQRINKITKRHLDFFYKEILKIDKIPAQSDSAYVVFELAKSFDQEKLEKGLGLEGGKDADGKKRIYELTEEFVANKTKVAQLKNLYYHKKEEDDEDNAGYYMRSSSVANSLDGQGEAFTGEDLSWLPFAYYQDEDLDLGETLDSPALQDAKIGFSVGADVLNLSEGERHVQFSIDFRDEFSGTDLPSINEIVESVGVYYTIKNKWEGPLKLIKNNSASVSSSDTVNATTEAPKTIEEYVTGLGSKRAEMYVKLETKDEATAPYDPEIHLGNLATESPVFKFIIDVNSESGIKVFKAFSKVITRMSVQVGVQGMRLLDLDSDTGKLNPTKPMYPFTSNPVKGSNLTIDHDEIFTKSWNTIQVNVKWQNTPDNFSDWYSAYQVGLNSNLSIKGYGDSQNIDPDFKSMVSAKSKLVDGLDAIGKPAINEIDDLIVSKQGLSPEDLDLLRTEIERKQNTAGDNPVVKADDYFKATRYVKLNNQWTKAQNGSNKNPVNLFQLKGSGTTSDDGIKHICQFTVTTPVSEEGDYAGPIKLSLNQPFFHEIYPQLYAIALASNDPNQIIPNKPYTPFCQEIVVDYTAKESITLTDKDESKFEERALTLFHELPFGHAIEHGYLRSTHEAQSSDCTLIPAVNNGGELYIGLEDAKNLQTVSLFIQLLEGSENPLVESFDKDNKVTWEVLCSDYWQPLDSIAVKLNEIDNFLKSGLVRLEIPKEATDDNMQLDKGLFWIKAVMPKSYDAVCRVLDVSAQGAMATFVNNGNELSHLESGLPAETIDKLEDRLAFVKSVTQPYNTFDGKPEENDASYYKRVSERIRHKNRAIALWDYENIVLQEFQNIYRVKCLNHTNTKSLLAAGCVTLAVVPDTVNKNMFNILQPRVSTAYLNKIQAYVSQLTSLHVKLDVINPVYEEVKIDITVKFYNEFDKALYTLELNEDLKKFLSPWAFDEAKNVEFGITLHQTVLIDFVERLHYVDYITSIKMFVGDPQKKMKNAQPSSPKAILVSAEQHKITPLDESATEQVTTEAEC